MPIVLIVDDSPTDQHIMASLLKRNVDWVVEFAKDGSEAIRSIENNSPDLVVTDLVMPEINGIELCQIGRKKFPQVPIILVTGQGSESLAIDALAAGAASYVPKTGLAKRLPQTVDQVLSMTARNRSKERLLQYTSSTRQQFNLENDPKLISAVTDFVRETMETLGAGDEIVVRHISVSVEEALFNAMFHGNWSTNFDEVQSARQSLYEDTFEDWLAENRPDGLVADRRVKVGVDISRNKVQFVVRDDGPGFDIGIFEKTQDPSHISEEGGRGLTLIRNFMEEVQFNDCGNEIRMMLRLTKETSQSQVAEPEMSE